MAVFLEIAKVKEAEEEVWYQFLTTDGRLGELSISRGTGEVSLIQPMPGDEQRKLYARAARKVTMHWRSGELPDKTCWAS